MLLVDNDAVAYIGSLAELRGCNADCRPVGTEDTNRVTQRFVA